MSLVYSWGILVLRASVVLLLVFTAKAGPTPLKRSIEAAVWDAPANDSTYRVKESSPETSAEKKAVLQIIPVVEVDGRKTEILLGDLLVAKGVSQDSIEALRMVRLADAPKAGEIRAFTSQGLEDVILPILKEIAVKTGEKISLKIPARVTVVRKSFTLKPADISDVIKLQLRESCLDCQFEVDGLVLPIVPASVSNTASWQIRMRGEIPKGAFSVPLDIENEDGSKRTFWISGKLTVLRKVPVASRALTAGERLRPEDFNFVSKDVTYANDVAPTVVELNASVLSRSASAGQVLWRNFLRREMAVKYGDLVKVVAGTENWQVSIDGVSQSTGYIGDLIKVKIPRTQKLVSGLLTERGLVEVK